MTKEEKVEVRSRAKEAYKRVNDVSYKEFLVYICKGNSSEVITLGETSLSKAVTAAIKRSEETWGDVHLFAIKSILPYLFAGEGKPSSIKLLSISNGKLNRVKRND